MESTIEQTACDLINFATYYGNNEAFLQLFDYVKNKMNNLIITEKVINYDNKKHYNLILSNTKSKKLDIIFCCHVDVVLDKEYKATIKNNKLYGRGAIDMKGQTAVILELLKKENTNKKFAIILTSDEEQGGFCCKRIMKEYSSKLAIIPDGGSDFNLIVEEKGLVQMELTSTGKSAHGSEPFNGDNAITKLMDLYNILIQKYPLPNQDQYNLSITLSKLHGGFENNKVPDKASMHLDIRFTKNDDIEGLIDFIKNYSKDIKVNILDFEPVFFVDENLKEIKDYIANCNKILNKKIKIKKCCAGSDAPYFTEKNIPVIMMNPIGKNWHSEGEYVNISSLYTLYEMFKFLL